MVWLDVTVAVEAFWLCGRGGNLLAVWERAEGEQSPCSAWVPEAKLQHLVSSPYSSSLLAGSCYAALSILHYYRATMGMRFGKSTECF